MEKENTRQSQKPAIDKNDGTPSRELTYNEMREIAEKLIAESIRRSMLQLEPEPAES